MAFTSLSRESLLLTCSFALVLSACPGDDSPPIDETSGTSSTTGDGDGDPATGDGDGDPTTGDGDGDPTTGDGDGDPTTGDGDGDPACTDAGCPCDPAEADFCDEGLYCDETDMVCTAPTCGDEVVEPLEDCDDGNGEDADGCDNDCSFTIIEWVDASYQNTCALLEGGRVRCWGENSAGQLGYGYTDDIGDDEFPADVGDVMLPVAGVELTMGDSHSCILMADAKVLCWGNGSSGKLGYASTENIGDDEFPSELDAILVGGDVLEIDAGGSQTCARLDNGKMRCWGAGASGQLGYGNSNTIGDNEHPFTAGDIPVGAAVLAQATGIGHTCAITAANKVRCWGAGYAGQLGYGNTETIGDDEEADSAGDASVLPMGVPNNTDAIALALGLSHSCALFETGEVLCWGANSQGQLGQGNTQNLGDDELPSTAPPIALPGPAIAISAGDNHTCALLETHEVVCWGANFFGQLGYGSTEPVGDDESPTNELLFDGGVKQVDAGGNHTCAIMEDTNELLCWGNNSSGQLGYGNTETIGDDEGPFELGAVPMF